MKRILLTGRNGQVGWELERSLAPLGEVLAFDHAGLDLANPDRIREVIRQAKPDIIVNAAAYTAVDRAESEPDPAMAINGVAPGVMAEEARRSGTLLVHYSTDYVFDGTKGTPYREDDPAKPVNVYGQSKLAGEKAIRISGCRHVIFRTGWVYGARGHNFMLKMLRLAKDRAELRVVADQVGSPTSSRMIAQATGLALHAPDLPDGIFHLASAGETSWHGFALAIMALTASDRERQPTVRPVSTREYSSRAARPANSRLDCDYLDRVTGIRLPHWETGLRLCLDRQLACAESYKPGKS